MGLFDGIGSVIGGALGGLFGGGGDASSDIEEAEQQAIAERRAEFEKAQQFLSPFMGAGQFAIPGLEALTGGDPAAVINRLTQQFQTSPGQQFIQQQATRALQNQAERAGLLDTGAERASLAQTVSGLASQNLNQFINQALGVRSSQQQALESLFGGGLGAGQALAGGALQTGAGIAGDLGNIGAAQAASALGRQRDISSLFGGIGGLIGGALGGGGFGGGGFGNLFGSSALSAPIEPSVSSLVNQFQQFGGGGLSGGFF